jgi:glycosyltransferase involved in cell wall biosynthesis
VSIVVSDPGHLPTTRQMALALALAHRLEAYWTPIPVRRGRRAVPAALADVARPAATTLELARLAASRARRREHEYALVWLRNTRFDRVVAESVADDATVVAQWGGALATFERVAHGTRILDYPIGRIDAVHALLEEEAQRRPELADTIVGVDSLMPHGAQLERIEREVELADAVVVGSRFAAESFAGVVEPRRVATIPYGTDTTRFAPGPPRTHSGPLRVLFAGQLTQRKGIADLLDAAALLDSESIEVRLVGDIVGSGRWLRAYRGVAEVVGPVARVVVYEALASGVPAIVTPNTGADAIRDGLEGFVVPIRTPSAIAEKLELLARDRQLLDEMAAAARTRALTLDWSRFRERFAALVLGETQAVAA